MKRYLFLLTLFLTGHIFWNQAWAQDGGRLVQGTLRDAETGETLIGVTVIEVGENDRSVQGQVTDLNGFFMMKVKSSASKLKFSYIGYKTVTLPIDKDKFEVRLEEDISKLETVEVTGERYSSDGFIAVRDRVSVSKKVDIKDLDAIMAPSVDEMLQGRISNVDISAVSGDPGSGMRIRIRGTSTITGNAEPMIVVDGVPFRAEIPSDFDFTVADDQGYGALLAIAPSDIASIEILKDAASAAIWGSNAANGVIMITTKRGRKARPTLSYNFNYGITDQPDPIPTLSGVNYTTLQKEAAFNVNGNMKFGNNFKELNYDPTWSEYHNYAQETDWLGAITRTGLKSEHNLSLSGGGDKARYRLGVGYLDDGGTTKNTGFKRVSARANLDYEVTTKLKISTDFSYVRSDRDMTYDSEKNNTPNERDIAYRKMPNESIWEYDEEGNRTGKYFTPDPFTTYQGLYNPVAQINDAWKNKTENRLGTNFRLRYNILTSLYFEGTLSFSAYSQKLTDFLPKSATGRDWTFSGVNKGSELDKEIYDVQTFSKLIYTPQIGDKHELLVMGQWQTSEFRDAGYASSVSNTPSGLLTDPSGAGRLSGVSNYTGRGRGLGGLTQFSYKYDDRYITQAGFRLDASSKFGSDNRWGAFPFASLGWRVTSEPFLRDKAQWINEFKIRGSFGVNGGEPRDAFLHYSRYKAGDNYLGRGGIFPANTKITNLQWSRTTQYNIGYDFHAFENRLNITMDFYKKRTTDMIFNGLAIPTASGFTSTTQNWGALTNKGVELAIDGTVYKRKDLKVDLMFNIAKNINVIESLPENATLKKGDVYKNGEYATSLVLGDPLGSFYGYRYKGVYKTDEDAVARDKNGEVIPDLSTGKPKKMIMGKSNYIFRGGDAMYEDVNKDGVIDELDVVYLGNSEPDVTGGFSVRVFYKGLSLSSFFNYRIGQDVINSARMGLENMYTRDNQAASVMRRWRGPGDDTDIPRAMYNAGYNWLGSDRFVEKASFLRWQNVTLTYTLDRKLLKRIGVTSMRFNVTAYNLMVFTDYTGQDPEVGRGGDPAAPIYDNARTPRGRSVRMGVNVTF
ncbi:SusC/RagA family TonB-linked outer membrane protein (plasmid) [Fulvitalea axinellae]|uniref:SusC/RagA family TonB-linked outer membrane protein n=1 Tax=Fulvitalea axinellae TaxID=1182444 RepID=A0AAU9CZM2_9BACT|nr:SusC/RagA family TonB-linked outer membrane protein [Fulvitalea axinellae]